MIIRRPVTGEKAPAQALLVPSPSHGGALLRAAGGLAALAVVIACGGCATEIAAGRASTGQPLVVRTRGKDVSWTTTDKVGEVRYGNGTGGADGTASVYATREHHATILKWRGFQGDHELADEDFFRIAGDGAAARASHGYRLTGHILVWTGGGVLAAGVATAVYGLAAHQDKLLGGGSLLSLLAGTAMFYGFAFLNPQNHAVPMSRAERAARRYDERLRRRAGGRTSALAGPMVKLQGSF